MLKKWTPWNWFKREEEQERTEVVPQRLTEFNAFPTPRFVREFDRLFERMFEDFVRGFRLAPWSDEGVRGVIFRPRVNISESSDHYTVELELPGVDKQDLELSVSDGVLTVRGEKRAEHEEKDRHYHRLESAYGSFERVLSLPTDADEERVEARYENGILRVTVPRRAESREKGRKIAIR